MNAERRKRIREVADAISAFESDIDYLVNEEQEYYDNMPESFQNGEKGDVAQDSVWSLEAARDAICEAVSNLEEAING
jgi:uncharacterized coiled-coil DUF342 family protein